MLGRVFRRDALQQEITRVYSEGDGYIWRCLGTCATVQFVGGGSPYYVVLEVYYRDKDTVWSVWEYIGGFTLQGDITYGVKVDNAEWTTLVVVRLELLCKDDQGKYTPLWYLYTKRQRLKWHTEKKDQLMENGPELILHVV